MWDVNVKAILACAAVVVLLGLPTAAFADDAPTDPPFDPTSVPPLVSEPLVIPPSTTPEGDFTNCCSTYTPPPDETPLPTPVVTAPWLNWTPEQMAALRALIHDGNAIRIDEVGDGSLSVQDVTGYTVDTSPRPWLRIMINGSTGPSTSPSSTVSEDSINQEGSAQVKSPIDTLRVRGNRSAPLHVAHSEQQTIPYALAENVPF